MALALGGGCEGSLYRYSVLLSDVDDRGRVPLALR